VIELPDAAELARIRTELSNSLLVMQEQIAPIFDAADGMRADLASRGYSTDAVESVVCHWLETVITICMVPSHD
jgi:hypothetical protein